MRVATYFIVKINASSRICSSIRSDVEETGTHNTKVSDSGYSNSCSNSQSQRSSGSTKSRNSGCSSGSSGYCGITSPAHGDVNNQGSKRKEKDHKKKKTKNGPSGVSCLAQGTPASTEQESVTAQQTCNSIPQSSSPQVSLQNGSNLMEMCPSNQLDLSAEALQIAALSQTLTSIKKSKYKEASQDDSEASPTELPYEVDQEEIISCLNAESSSHEQEANELKMVVSMSDGLVVYTTSAISTMLGYPKDMWIGRSLIDFVHPRHSAYLAGHITTAIANIEPGQNSTKSSRNSFYCCLRKYRGLKALGFGITDKKVSYLPCEMSVSFKEISNSNQTKIYLVITASPIISAYKYEMNMSPKFITRHSANCHLCHVDPGVTLYFGYLPQDILGRSVLDFYHPEDLHFMKEVYEAVMKEQGHPFKSKPHRFRCQNGGYALVETELSSFINPWTRKLEFIICQHTVLRGPTNPDVTSPVLEPEPLKISEEVLKESKIVQEEIKCLLNETVTRTSETAKQQVSKRCKDLAAFMENLMDEITKPPDLKVDVPTEEQSFSERDSVTLGEISPHHEYYDSKSSSEAPPSYNQLNYNENIQRFFDSKPKTTVSDESGESKNGSGDEESKITPVVNSSSVSKSGGSGVSSGQSTESNGHSGETTTNTSNNTTQTYKPPTLTEQLLSRHNEDMEKKMVQKHREQRNKGDREQKGKDRLKQSFDKGQEESGSHHGVKRSGSHSWEGEPYKAIKANHINLQENGDLPVAEPDPNKTQPPNLWPSVGMPLPGLQQPKRREYPGPSFGSAVMPMYYVTNPRPGPSATYQHSAFTTQQTVQYVPSMVYHPVAMFGAPPVMFSPLTVFPSPGPPYQTNGGNDQETMQNLQTAQQQQKRPPSQGTSLKAEPGSAMCSVASASLQGHSEKGKLSSGLSPLVNGKHNQKQNDQEADSVATSIQFDDSSYHSSFYSFLKTDKSDESMKSSSENEKHEENWGPHRPAAPKARPIRKVAPWLEDVNLSPELILKYQLKERSLEEILKEDLKALEKLTQPALVNDQLSQMYLDLELEGLSKHLTLDEGMTSSSESSDEENNEFGSSLENLAAKKKKQRNTEYDRMTILFEEDAPFPPPLAAECS
ncbi:period circadian regulator isoform X3 [Rhodnius prolixus]|uniref:period circadian regulator isoform X3 n=1 Tax=Rhodnius prolixus TaxID=13249 RepID=UPI003D1888F8